MKNMFKQNSRFAALVDEIGETKKENNTKPRDQSKKSQGECNPVNQFKNNNSIENRNSRNYENRDTKRQTERRLKEEQIRKERKEKEMEEQIKQSLSAESFPDLVSNISNEKQTMSTMNFLNKLKNENIKVTKESKESKANIVVDEDYENLKPGWAIAKKDFTTGKIITKYKKSQVPEPRVKTEREIGLDIINALVELHKKRTEEYINMWGYDTWEKMYRFPNYDYAYFDKLDELYEEMENEDNEENSDYDYDTY